MKERVLFRVGFDVGEHKQEICFEKLEVANQFYDCIKQSLKVERITWTNPNEKTVETLREGGR